MLDIAVLGAFLVLLGLAIAWARSLAWVSVAFLVLVSLVGAAIQATLALDLRWTFRELQVGLLAGMAVIAGVAWWMHRSGRSGRNLRHQLLVIGIPILVLALVIIAMRLTAAGSPAPLSGVNWLAARPFAEDNAKWLNLAAQLASGRELEFNGYAGGPLVMIVVLMATVSAALSQVLLGGFNEMAVAVSAVIGTELLLVALAPLALAPFAEFGVPRKPLAPGATRMKVPPVAVWSGLLVSVPATAVLLGYGHLTLEYVLLVVALWSSTFLVGGRSRARLLMSIVVIATSSVWFPLNGIALVLLIAGWVWVVARLVRGSRDWVSLAAMVAITAVVWDALVSSSLFVLGVGLSDASEVPGSGAAGGLMAGVRVPTLDIPLLEAGGGTEAASAVLVVLAGVGLVAAGFVLSRFWNVSTRTQLVAFGPILLLIAYAMGITVLDALLTGNAPNYGSQKMGYMVTVVVATVTLPIAVLAIDARRTGMTVLRWAAVVAIGLAMTADTLLPRGLSQLSSSYWAAPDPEDPPYWSSAEVQPVAEQPISSAPVACVFLPPGAEKPSGQPDAQLVYNCTRLLVGLGGLEGRVGGLMDWVTSDWLSSGSFWNEWHPSISGASDDAKSRRVVLLGNDGSVIGFETLGGLLERYPPPESP